MRVSEDLRALREFYRDHLLGNLIPWWLRHAVDHQHGGVCQFIEDDGTVVSTDKYMWTQLRALYTFSALYNRIEARVECLEVARGIFDFVLAHGRNADGDWHYWLTAEGGVVEGPTSIYTDGFAIIGMTEYARATGDPQALDVAVQTFERARARLAHPGSYLTAPYTVPAGAKAHGVSMIFSHAFYQLGKLLGDEEIMQAGYEHCL